jgi:hypothetical protein
MTKPSVAAVQERGVHRHPELVSGSRLSNRQMLNRVQHDEALAKPELLPTVTPGAIP